MNFKAMWNLTLRWNLKHQVNLETALFLTILIPQNPNHPNNALFIQKSRSIAISGINKLHSEVRQTFQINLNHIVPNSLSSHFISALYHNLYFLSLYPLLLHHFCKKLHHLTLPNKKSASVKPCKV